MTSTSQDPPTHAENVVGERADPIRYLSPTPPGFRPEINYLATLEAFVDEAKTDGAELKTGSPYLLVQELARQRHHIYLQLEEKRCSLRGKERVTRVCAIDNLGSTDCLVPPVSSFADHGAKVAWIYQEIQAIRLKLVGNAQGCACVLLVNQADALTLQVLGAALKLDPSFLFGISILTWLWTPFFRKLPH